MSRNVKIILGIVAAIVAVCCLGAVTLYVVGQRFLSQAVVTDSARAAEVGRAIADYDLPAGYAERIAMDMIATRVVFIGLEDDSSGMFIMLMQFPTGMADEEQMRQQLDQAFQQQSGQSGLSMEVVEEKTVTIRGESVTLTVREGQSENGVTFWQVNGVFQGKSGPAMLSLSGLVDEWDQTLVDDFIESIR